ncbi:hypothetical protein DPMN_128252 [Dreissena polymorpha]|uniref:Uncharacterized protein n=1 Tax=Dreissena polymorpha TaxID=45954 RepID=A0A9D4GZ43_DREPO|nr:hypothetical protein DPMN_128252 [Dreissena polymorpha]
MINNTLLTGVPYLGRKIPDILTNNADKVAVAVELEVNVFLVAVFNDGGGVVVALFYVLVVVAESCFVLLVLLVVAAVVLYGETHAAAASTVDYIDDDDDDDADAIYALIMMTIEQL